MNRPGPLFENLQPIRKDYRKEKIVFSDSKPLSFGFFALEFDWIRTGVEYVRETKRCTSYPEFWEIIEATPFFRVVNYMHVELISAGKTVVLLLNTCPVAQVDIRGEKALADLFDLPPMSKEEWDCWQLLGAGTIRFEVIPNDDHLCLKQIKVEEGALNTLQIERTIDLTNGDTKLNVKSKQHRMPRDPSLENLVDWIEVRSGKTHPVALIENY